MPPTAWEVTTADVAISTDRVTRHKAVEPEEDHSSLRQVERQTLLGLDVRADEAMLLERVEAFFKREVELLGNSTLFSYLRELILRKAKYNVARPVEQDNTDFPRVKACQAFQEPLPKGFAINEEFTNWRGPSQRRRGGS